ncbi:MAG: ABC transporter substrate-binding protein [Rikenellaceae bacterium]|nr:ABC transporter substrate-binding protein [Rikenellaceae bacterium]
MKFSKVIFIIFGAAIIAACTDDAPPKRDFTEVYSPKYARGFDVVCRGTDTLLRIFSPFQGQKQSAREFSLETPARRIVCMSSSHVAYLDRLDAVERVVGVSGVRFLSTPRIDRSKVREVGYDSNLNYELITALRPDVVLLYGITGENSSLSAKLDELGIRYAYLGEHAEVTPLGKSEWLVAMGYLCGLEEKAVAEFGAIAERYEQLRSVAAECVEHPTVMLNAPYQDVWYVPSDDSYMVALVADAGGKYACAGDSSHMSRPIDIETAYTKVMEADVWLNTNQMRSLKELQTAHPRFADTPTVRRGRVYNNVARQNSAGGSDFWESGAVCADVVLSDMIEILHPELLEHELYYYLRLQ